MFNEMSQGRKLALVAAFILFLAKQSNFNLNDLTFPQNSATVTEELPKPSAELITLCEPLVELYKQDKDLTYDAAYFYMAFADVVSRNPHNFIETTSDFKNYNEIALDYMFENNPAKGKIKDLGKEIDSILASQLTLDPNNKVEAKKLGELLYAIGWTAYNAL